MQSKIKDTNLRVDRFDHLYKSGKKKLEDDDLSQYKRNRTTSSVGIPLKHNLSEKFANTKPQAVSPPFLNTLKNSLGFGGLAAE
jgi:hypothetical protein